MIVLGGGGFGRCLGHQGGVLNEWDLCLFKKGSREIDLLSVCYLLGTKLQLYAHQSFSLCNTPISVLAFFCAKVGCVTQKCDTLLRSPQYELAEPRCVCRPSDATAQLLNLQRTIPHRWHHTLTPHTLEDGYIKCNTILYSFIAL